MRTIDYARKSGIAICIIIVVAMMSLPVHAGIAGSRHDFTGYTGDKCSVCHVPHKPLLNVPLWAHQLTTTTFYLYNTNSNYSGINSNAYDSSPTNLGSGKSRLCLSCHDGTVAIASGFNAFMPTDGVGWILWTNGDKALPGWGNLQEGLKGVHPIAVNYNMVRTNQPDNFNDISSDPDVKLDVGKVQCTSCHNPHNKFPKMLVKSNAGSAICLTCHNK